MAKVKMSSFFGGIAIICQKTKVFADVLQKLDKIDFLYYNVVGDEK